MIILSLARRRLLRAQLQFSAAFLLLDRHDSQLQFCSKPGFKSDKRLSDITRADIFDLRSRLLKKNAPATVNKVIGVAKIILRESVIREELKRDPTEYVRNVKAKKRARAIFTVDELKKLFPEHGSGPWNNPRDYTCFFTLLR